jgi:hypothetical protein
MQELLENYLELTKLPVQETRKKKENLLKEMLLRKMLLQVEANKLQKVLLGENQKNYLQSFEEFHQFNLIFLNEIFFYLKDWYYYYY